MQYKTEQIRGICHGSHVAHELNAMLYVYREKSLRQVDNLLLDVSYEHVRVDVACIYQPEKQNIFF